MLELPARSSDIADNILREQKGFRFLLWCPIVMCVSIVAGPVRNSFNRNPTLDHTVASWLVWALVLVTVIVVLVALHELRRLARVPHQIALSRDGLSKLKFGVQTDFKAWSEFTAVRIIRITLPRGAGNEGDFVKRNHRDNVLFHILSPTMPTIALNPSRFSCGPEVLALTLDTLLPETCNRDQSFRDCLAWAKTLVVDNIEIMTELQSNAE